MLNFQGVSSPKKKLTCHLKRVLFKGKIAFQALFFRGYGEVFRGSNMGTFKMGHLEKKQQTLQTWEPLKL